MSTTTRARTLSVRFEDTCVLIPPPCRIPMSVLIRPRLITKSYSLPLWKPSKSGPLLPDPVPSLDHDLACVEAEKDRTEKKPFSLTVSVPSLTTKLRSRRPSLPLPSPCLSKRNAQSSSTPPTPLTSLMPSPSLCRTPSVPQIQPANLKQAETIPLRPCCEACHPCVDAALAEGERWSEKWSSGAVRRYSEGEHVHLHAPNPAVFGFARVWTPDGACNANPEVSLAEALKIDEVDAKRRSGDFSHAVLNNRPVPPSAKELALADSDDDERCPEPVLSIVPSSSCHTPVVQEEEDEDLLFPLPSPRRSPSQTPNPTPPGSQVNLAVPPSGSQTNLSVPLPGNQASFTTQSDTPTPSRPRNVENTLPVTRASPPPSVSISIPPALSTVVTPSNRESSPAHKRQRSASPTVTRSRQAHRPSFSSTSGSFLKGSASVLKGVAAGMTGGGAGVGVVR